MLQIPLPNPSSSRGLRFWTGGFLFVSTFLLLPSLTLSSVGKLAALAFFYTGYLLSWPFWKNARDSHVFPYVQIAVDVMALALLVRWTGRPDAYAPFLVLLFADAFLNGSLTLALYAGVVGWSVILFSLPAEMKSALPTLTGFGLTNGLALGAMGYLLYNTYQKDVWNRYALSRARCLWKIADVLSETGNDMNDKLRRISMQLAEPFSSQGVRCRILLHEDPALAPPTLPNSSHYELSYEDRFHGTLVLSAKTPLALDPTDVRFLWSVAHLLSSHIHREKSRQTLDRSVRHLEAEKLL